MELNRKARGRILHVERHRTWLARGDVLYLSEDEGQSFQKVARLPRCLKRQWGAWFGLLRRLLRVGIKHFIPLSENKWLIQGNLGVFIWDNVQKKWSHQHPIKGSNPLAVCRTPDGRLYYGEYLNNPQRAPVQLWCSGDDGQSFRPIFTFENVRHIHGVYFDAYDNKLWITTGDEDHESAIWCSDLACQQVKKVWHGEQKFRAIPLIFTDAHIYYGTDTPVAQNYLYRFHRQTMQLETLAAVEGSVFHAAKAKDWVLFSTACEPSVLNTSRQVALWGSYQGQDWQRLMTFDKDIWPMKYFQYGQLFLTPNHQDGIWVTPFATYQHEISYLYK